MFLSLFSGNTSNDTPKIATVKQKFKVRTMKPAEVNEAIQPIT